jgi:hypothetical protein
VGMWECGNVGMWECGNVGMWECGNVGMWECGMWDVGWGCGMWNVECGMWNVECGMWNVECGMWNVECGMWNVECGMEQNNGLYLNMSSTTLLLFNAIKRYVHIINMKCIFWVGKKSGMCLKCCVNTWSLKGMEKEIYYVTDLFNSPLDCSSFFSFPFFF